ncbi:MAG: hypothetical protein JXM69_09640 [Anaerolineae bacterium]|nr:hypothetical protein [Anaerolineae bacterium]
MKYARVFIFLMVLVSLLVAGCASAAAPPPADEPVEAPTADVPSAPTEAAPATDDSPWQIVLDIEVEQPMRMAAFLDENFGLTGGADTAGKAQYTTNGGEIWTMADTSGG